MELTGFLRRGPLVAILRGVRPDEVVGITAMLERQGIAIVEVPLNSPEPLVSIAALAEAFGDRMLIGAGTVTTEAQVREIAAAGGRLIVTPHADPSVVRAAKGHGLLAVPGFFTPTEAFAMLAAGADALKLFPAEAASPPVLRAIRAVLPPGVMVLPVGGIEAANIPAWAAAGAAGFGSVRRSTSRATHRRWWVRRRRCWSRLAGRVTGDASAAGCAAVVLVGERAVLMGCCLAERLLPAQDLPNTWH